MQRSMALVLGAYTWWGLSALFWRELNDVDALDQLAWRVVSAFVLLGLWLGWQRLRHADGGSVQLWDRHAWFRGAAASVLITTNWGAFLWAVSNGQAVQASLGYFLMPLFSAALGVLVLGEKLRLRPGLALGLAVCGVMWLVVSSRELPIVALVLGSSFALYGLAKKKTEWNAPTSLMVEVSLVAPPMMAVLAIRANRGFSIVGDRQPSTLAMLVAAGVVTVVPLLLFAKAARQVPLILIGLLQYLNPTLQFLVGWLILDEVVDGSRLLGFGFVWMALAIIVFDQLTANPTSEQPQATSRASPVLEPDGP